MHVVVVICYKFICKFVSFYDMTCYASSYASLYASSYASLSLFMICITYARLPLCMTCYASSYASLYASSYASLYASSYASLG